MFDLLIMLIIIFFHFFSHKGLLPFLGLLLHLANLYFGVKMQQGREGELYP